MALYLQMDGVDDYIKTPSITFNEVIIDAVFRQKTGAWQNYLDTRTGYSSYLLRDTSNKDNFVGMSVYVDGVQKTTGTTFVPSNQRTTLRMVINATATDDVNIFSKNTNVEPMPGDIYSVKFLNSGTVIAYYDMSTGTVLDQSGNGKNATLNGGTWLDDGTGGATGTDGSTAFDLRQSLYSDGAANGDTKQLFFADGAVYSDVRNVLYSDSSMLFDTLEQIYADASVQTDMKQAIYSDSATGYDTRQSLYSDASTLFDTLQEFFSDGIVGSTPFDIRMVLYADSAAVFDSKQAFYSDGALSADLAQQFYQSGANSSDIKLVIYADASSKFDASQTLYSDASVKADTAQRFYTEGTIDFDTLQAILEDWNEYHEVIRLVLNVTQNKSAMLEITQRMQSELKM